MAQLDTSILGSYQPIQLPNPVDNYKNALNIKAKQSEQMFKQTENALKQTQVDKNKIEALGQQMQQSRELLSQIQTPEQFLGWSQGNHDPNTLIGQYLASHGVTHDSTVQMVQKAVEEGTFPQLRAQAALGLDKALKMHYQPVNTGGYQNILAIPEYNTGDMKATEVPGSRQKATLSPNRPVTNINNNVSTKTEGAYGSEFGKGVAKTDLKLYEGAQNAQDLIDASKEIINVVKSGKLITGTAADTRLAIARALNTVGANNAETVSNTEKFQSTQAKQVMNYLNSIGGAKAFGGRMNQSEFNIIKEAAAGKHDWSPQGIIKLERSMIKGAQIMQQDFNKRLKKMPKAVVQSMNLEPVSIENVSSPVPKSFKASPEVWNAMTPEERKLFQ